MTHTSTEQERADFEKYMLLENYFSESDLVWNGDDGYDCPDADDAFDIWLMARRAQVVPQGWSLHEAAKDALDWLGDEDLNMTHNIRERLRTALAAAPQPPEAAPVQMPEPVAYVHVPSLLWNGEVRPVVSFEKYEGDHKDGVYSTRTPLYTEHQVRQLLAAHGIK